MLAGLFTRVSAWATNALTLLFFLALLQGAARGLEIDCGCFGSSAGETSNLWLAAARDLGLLALGFHVVLASRGPSASTRCSGEVTPRSLAEPDLSENRA